MGGAHPVNALTEAGQDFAPMVQLLGVWGQRWTRSDLQEHEIDLGLLLWSMESSAHPSAFGDRRCVIRLELTDEIASRRFWWFLNQSGTCELCLEDPGGDVGLYVACTLPDAIRVVRGDIALAAAPASGRLEIIGEAWVRDAFAGWLNLSPLAHITPRRN